MGFLFLFFGYMGVPVTFALIAGVFVATAFTPISMQSIIGQLFHGIDSETLLAVPFFLLAQPHRRARDGQGGLRPRIHGRVDRLRVDDGEPDSAEHHGGGLRRHRQRLDRRPVPCRRRARRVATIAFVVLFPDVVLALPKWLLPESLGCFKSPTGTGYICP